MPGLHAATAITSHADFDGANRCRSTPRGPVTRTRLSLSRATREAGLATANAAMGITQTPISYEALGAGFGRADASPSFRFRTPPGARRASGSFLTSQVGAAMITLLDEGGDAATAISASIWSV